MKQYTPPFKVEDLRVKDSIDKVVAIFDDPDQAQEYVDFLNNNPCNMPLQNINEKQKDQIINSFAKTTAKYSLAICESFGLKIGFGATFQVGSDDDKWYLSFTKVGSKPPSKHRFQALDFGEKIAFTIVFLLFALGLYYITTL